MFCRKTELFENTRPNNYVISRQNDLFFFLYFIVFICKLYKRQAKIHVYPNASFTIFTQKRIQDERKKMKREEKKKKEKKWEGEVEKLITM